MARSLNKLLLIGNVGADPELAHVGESRVARFSLATTESWQGRDGERHEKTQWHRLSLWGALADIADRYIRKGDKLYVEGRVEYRTWQREDNTTGYATDIRVDELIMLGSPGFVRPAESGAPAGNAPRAPRESRERGAAMYQEYPDYGPEDTEREPLREEDVPPRQRPDGLAPRRRPAGASKPPARKSGAVPSRKRRGR